MKTLYKKILTGVFILLFMFLFKIPNVDAASCRMGVSAPSSVVAGKSFKVTVTVSSSAALGSWEYTLSYDSSKAKLNSGTLHTVDYGNGSKTSASYTYTFTATQSGSMTFKPVNASILDYATTNECLAGVGSATVTAKTQAEIEASYSKNNNLASLAVEGATLSPAFSASTTEYTVVLPADTTKAKIIASAADNAASITGAGEIDVVDGLNKIEVTVTAQHGEKKTYLINLTVEELDPITVKIKGKTYTIVRKSGMVEDIPVGFAENKINIGKDSVVAYTSDITKLTLLALKDNDGNIKLYIYDAKKKSYMPFEEVKGASTNLLILSKIDKKVPYGFVKTTFKYKDRKIDAYKIKKDGKINFYLVYAQNLETGNKDFYVYDTKDQTFQRYYDEYVEYNNNIMKYLVYIILGLVALIVLRIVLKILKKLFTTKKSLIRKYEKKLAKLKKEEDEYLDDVANEKLDKEYSLDDLDDTPLITKVEKDEYKVPKKTRKEKAKELEEAKKRINKNKPKYRKMSLEDDNE